MCEKVAGDQCINRPVHFLKVLFISSWGYIFFQTNVKNIQNALKNLFDKNNSVFSCTEYRTILTYWPTEKSWLFLKKKARKLFAKIEKCPTLKSKKGPKTSKFDQIFTLKKIKNARIWNQSQKKKSAWKRHIIWCTQIQSVKVKLLDLLYKMFILQNIYSLKKLAFSLH